MALAIAFISLFFSAFFSGIEIAFISSNKLQLELEKSKGKFSSKMIAFFSRNESDFITTMLVGNNISLVIYGIFMGDRILQMMFPETLQGLSISIKIILIQTLISTIIILITAEFLPKVIFQQFSNTFMKVFAFPTAIFYFIFSPVTAMIMSISDLILKKLKNITIFFLI